MPAVGHDAEHRPEKPRQKTAPRKQHVEALRRRAPPPRDTRERSPNAEQNDQIGDARSASRKNAETAVPITPPTVLKSRRYCPSSRPPSLRAATAAMTPRSNGRARRTSPTVSGLCPAASTCARHCRWRRCGRRRPRGAGRTPRPAAPCPEPWATGKQREGPDPGDDIGDNQGGEQHCCPGLGEISNPHRGRSNRFKFLDESRPRALSATCMGSSRQGIVPDRHNDRQECRGNAFRRLWERRRAFDQLQRVPVQHCVSRTFDKPAAQESPFSVHRKFNQHDAIGIMGAGGIAMKAFQPAEHLIPPVDERGGWPGGTPRRQADLWAGRQEPRRWPAPRPPTRSRLPRRAEPPFVSALAVSPCCRDCPAGLRPSVDPSARRMRPAARRSPPDLARAADRLLARAAPKRRAQAPSSPPARPRPHRPRRCAR